MKYLVLFFFLNFSMMAKDKLPRPSYNYKTDISTILGGDVGLSDERKKDVSKIIANITKNISDQYYVSDGLTLTMYLLRILSEIGHYELVYSDVAIIVRSLEKILEEPFDEEVWTILDQIRKFEFGKKRGMYFVKIFAKNPEKGIYLDLTDELTEEDDVDEEEEFAEVLSIHMKDQSEVYFEDVVSEKQYEETEKIVKKKYRLVGLFGKDLNTIHPDVVEYFDNHMYQVKHQDKEEGQLITPLLTHFKGVSVLAQTEIPLVKKLKVKFTKGVLLPGMRYEESPLPSFIIHAKTGILKIRTSIDQ